MSSTKRLRSFLAIAGVAALAAGCSSAPKPKVATNGRVTNPVTPLEQYPLKAVERPEQVALSVHAHGVLSPAQETALAGFAQTWREAGGGAPVIVEGPRDGSPDAELSVHAAADKLVALGVAPGALRIGAYDSRGDAAAPVLAHFERLAVDMPDCSKGWDNLVATNSNEVSTHFGCATARNFAAMLADPRDLQGPRPITPADAGRRAAVLDKYRQGVVTSSARDDQANGAVSQRVR